MGKRCPLKQVGQGGRKKRSSAAAAKRAYADPGKGAGMETKSIASKALAGKAAGGGRRQGQREAQKQNAQGLRSGSSEPAKDAGRRK